MNELEGQIKTIGETTQYGANFRKREFILTTEEKYPQDIKLEFYQDDCQLLDTEEIGNNVTVFYNLKGNEYKGKYYVNLQAWKLTPTDAEKENESSEGAPAPKKRGRPPKKEEPQIESQEDLTENIEELADAPF